ncbi:hypothetical protein GWI33_004708 [Rhynchophorus ferrugineus]|uniref:Uridine diphosphate glucose pyrophosphatase NUDT14 n=1 Tax=Rhynchophorus ferrugineus TaxID=354439 RepID=A0A834IUL4_RHYFE|nr:hypothetical protein GWI33_004708 [Rhynchophorus ferrugineus]
MENISDVFITNYIPTIYTTPRTLKYNQNGHNKSADVFLERNGVVIILYNKTKDVLVLVKQFRASVYFQEISKNERFGSVDVSKCKPEKAVTLEFCAGLEDKTLPTEKIAQEEIFEECGYQVSTESLQKIISFCNLSETTGAQSTFYYCEVTEDQRINQGGGNLEENENIEVVEMKVEDVLNYAKQNYVYNSINATLNEATNEDSAHEQYTHAEAWHLQTL